MLAAFVARRDNLNDGDNVPRGMVNGDAVGLGGVNVDFRRNLEASFRRRLGHGDSSVRLWGLRRVQGNHIRYRTAEHLFRQGVIARRQSTAIQCVLDGARPSMVEIIEHSGRHACPVVHRHREASRQQQGNLFRSAALTILPRISLSGLHASAACDLTAPVGLSLLVQLGEKLR